MKAQPHSLKERQKRKLLLVLPLLILPFTTLFFWALGGGQKASATDAETKKGLNTLLPDASLRKDSGQNKMSYYDRAAADSLKLKVQMKSDPYYRDSSGADTTIQFPAIARGRKGQLSGNIPGLLKEPDQRQENERQVDQKLKQLQSMIERPEKAETHEPDENSVPGGTIKTDIQEREDPELKQMNGLLEKILDIQHPERLAVKKRDSLEDRSMEFQAIPAEIYEDQRIVQSSVVGLKFLDSTTINGQFVPKGQLIFGTGNLSNQRLHLDLKMLKIGYRIIPVRLTVFDMKDGLEGIDVPEAITDDAIRNGAVNGVQSVDIMTMEPSWSAQMAGAGVNMAKGLFSKKVKRVKAKLKGGHLVLLRVDKIK